MKPSEPNNQLCSYTFDENRIKEEEFPEMPTKLKDTVKNFHKLTNKINTTFLVELFEYQSIRTDDIDIRMYFEDYIKYI